jgi:kynurenine formamidase
MFSGEIGYRLTVRRSGPLAVKVGNDIRYYNGMTQAQVGGAYGLQKLGIHNLGPIFTRGIMLDVATYKGVDRLPINYVITMDDVMKTLQRQGTREPGEGDVVLFHTGHSKLWKKYNEEYNKGCPGPGKTVANWLVDKKIMVVGADTWPWRLTRTPTALRVPRDLDHDERHLHQQNLNLDGLVKDRVYEFAWSFNPLALKGATGSQGNSVALA